MNPKCLAFSGLLIAIYWMPPWAPLKSPYDIAFKRAVTILLAFAHINTLFLTGKAFSVFPLRLIYNWVPRPAGDDISPVQIGFSVPKKKFGSSVKRHRIRRLMVEAWRLNKHTLYPAIPADKQLHIFLIFTHTELPEYAIVEGAVVKGIGKLRDLSPTLSKGEGGVE